MAVASTKLNIRSAFQPKNSFIRLIYRDHFIAQNTKSWWIGSDVFLCNFKQWSSLAHNFITHTAYENNWPAISTIMIPDTELALHWVLVILYETIASEKREYCRFIRYNAYGIPFFRTSIFYFTPIKSLFRNDNAIFICGKPKSATFGMPLNDFLHSEKHPLW